MAVVSQTTKTRTGIKRFILPTAEGDNSVLAFMYDDKKIEVHLLKHECAPLYLEENSSVALVNSAHIGHYLIAVTATVKQNKGHTSLVFRTWDLTSVLGFTPKEIHAEIDDHTSGANHQDGKSRGHLNLNESIADASNLTIDSLNSVVAVMVDREVLVWEMNKNDAGVLNLKYQSTIKLSGNRDVGDMTLLFENGFTSVIISDIGSIRIWSLDSNGCHSSQSVSIPSSTINAPSVPYREIQRITQYRVVFSDGLGKLWIFCLKTNSLISIRLPGCGVGDIYFSYVKQKEHGLLAICEKDYSISLYQLPAITDQKPIELSTRPYKGLLNNSPISSLVFLHSDILAVASCSDRTLCVWAGLSSSSSSSPSSLSPSSLSSSSLAAAPLIQSPPTVA